MTAVEDNLSNQLLIALPAMADPNFARSVALICQHDDEGAMGVDFLNTYPMYRVGKKAAGRLLDGRTWDGFPS